MDLSRFPRRKYTEGFTPLEKLTRFSEALGGPGIYIKRDDLLDLTEGGNKTRKLEFVVADAMEKGCDTLITCGSVQSNSSRLTLSAAIKEGLSCRLVLLEHESGGKYKPKASGNNLLFHLLGAKDIRTAPAGADATEEMQAVAEEAKAQGRTIGTSPRDSNGGD
jgi:D-cysteine desulfhydrase